LDVTFNRAAGTLSAYGLTIVVSFAVRLNKDGTGPRSVPDGVPYMPIGFPKSPPEGWKITGVFPRDKILKPHLWPLYISTNAWQMVPEWEVTEGGVFVKPTGRWVHDAAYGIHFSDLDFTQGCIRVVNQPDLEELAAKVQAELDEIRAIDPTQAWVSMEAA
jgi:hypothetical protein